MIINYSDKPVIESGKPSIFLAGPTPRSLDVITWRIEAIKILERFDYDGVVYVPELEHDNRDFDYTNQVWWERKALHNASVISFWIPRDEKMPAYTTNVEFGYWLSKDADKVLYGRPDYASKVKYLDWLYSTETNRVPYNNIDELLESAIKLSKELY